VQPEIAHRAQQKSVSTSPTRLQNCSTQSEITNSKDDSQQTARQPIADQFLMCQAADSSDGFLLVEGPGDLVIQLFCHYGHPVRSEKGFFGDRLGEIISTITIIGFTLVYPVGILVFILAPYQVQWIWLGYHRCTMFCMYAYRFLGGDDVGSTQSWVSRELVKHGQVLLVDEHGNRVFARLQSTLVSSAAEGRDEVDRLVSHFLKLHS
jgi:hypothetical protein